MRIKQKEFVHGLFIVLLFLLCDKAKSGENFFWKSSETLARSN